jgi:hypothetical protein
MGGGVGPIGRMSAAYSASGSTDSAGRGGAGCAAGRREGSTPAPGTALAAATSGEAAADNAVGCGVVGFGNGAVPVVWAAGADAEEAAGSRGAGCAVAFTTGAVFLVMSRAVGCAVGGAL